ncbi:MAG TPA: metallophosphoesterase [Euryarchaeota archaeon]|nr:metallophosphoesterase [Euryarchaeota archaeon]
MRIAHLSDLHCGRSWMFDESALTNAIDQINETSPDMVVITGDLTDWGLDLEYTMAKKFISRIKKKVLTVPGNHDARYMGYKIFEKTFTKPFGRFGMLEKDDFLFIGLDTSEPGLDEGHLGREQLAIVEENVKKGGPIPIIMQHHHIIPIPETGRERNVLVDAGEVLRVLNHHEIPLILTGHKHVSWVWNLNGTFISNVGTVSCHRAFQDMGWNIVDIEDGKMDIIKVNSNNGKKSAVLKGGLLRGR